MTDHLAPWMLLPCASDKCPACAVDHTPDMPHDWRSLFYHYSFFKLNGRYPTWEDAMAHCAENVKIATREVVAEIVKRRKKP